MPANWYCAVFSFKAFVFVGLRYVWRCNVYESTHQWAKDCSHANKEVSITDKEKHSKETVHITFMTEETIGENIGWKGFSN